MEEPTMPNANSSDGYASVVIRYHRSEGTPKEPRLIPLESVDFQDDRTVLRKKDVPAEGGVKPEAVLFSDSLLSTYKAYKPTQNETEAIHDTGIERSTSPSSECSQEVTPVIQRKHFTVRKYHARILKPEEPLMSVVRRTWKSP